MIKGWLYMWKRTLTKENLVSLLTSLDLAVLHEIGPFNTADMVVVGGAAFICEGLTERELTQDIDVIEASEPVAKCIPEIEEMNANCAAFLDCLPYGYEDRLVEIPLPLTSIRVFRPSLEDLVVMKLRSYRNHDIEDITSPEVLRRIDWEQLHRLVYDPHEAKASCMADIEYDMLVLKYEEFRDRWHPAREGEAS